MEPKDQEDVCRCYTPTTEYRIHPLVEQLIRETASCYVADVFRLPNGGHKAMKAPKNKRYYNPQEKPRRYPLELGKDHHICLWSEDGKFKWTIAFFHKVSEGFDLNFVGDRPLDERVNWDHFRDLVLQGQKLADEEFEKGKPSVGR